MSAPIIQNLSALSSSVANYSRQQLGTLRNRIFQKERSKTTAGLAQTSFALHRPVWVAGGGAMYTTMGAVYLTLRYMSRLR
ncbi:hypothetical protein ALT_2587 [Aspergillus lentulus]|uniref:Uncharacterized protein n=1 Tax=Aspergillus lentulus TaxID=293939 RepID=A0AAN4PFA7_ASPLE|nr:uncharacterized protein IFM58399_06829 [Aspergillus lentulus]KAF4160155.1 hypothetical protein CNMCM6069_009226 [Aspergillus lentulus]KAF4170117.1 hypothetical protein CNMCM6936_005262 [Aspergillus lentulus]KAF4181429.1 hypothetical protein CNMCM7927_000665 [Aspergillus lentulus]KAF4181757.1 hypothetical protein CNMCM8060_008128 [Aspergillus lentulus]KAF4198199.1 hypothetical protein CNMCM8694_000883 [Aspergillus lentulus]